MKLDLGSANRPRDGFESVDLYHPEATHKINLWQFPFPWKDNSVEELACSHFLEHLPARDVLRSDCNVYGFIYQGWDFLFAFMSECYRILQPNGIMHIVVPNARCNRAFQDPTHRRFFVEEVFCYFSKAWREANGLNHYNINCDFDFTVQPAVPIGTDISTLTPERIKESWNLILEWHATLTALK